MTPLRPESGRLVDHGCDRCAGVTAPAPPSDCPSHCMSSGSVCAITRRIGGRALPRCLWLRHPVRPGIPRATRLREPTAAQTSRLYPPVRCVGSGDGGNAHTKPATAPPWAARCPYDTAAATRRKFFHQSERSSYPDAQPAPWPCGADGLSSSAGAPASADRPGTHHSLGP
jgi:hypothetical protein